MKFFNSKDLTSNEELNLTNTITTIKREAKKDESNKGVYLTFLKSMESKKDILVISLIGFDIDKDRYKYFSNCGFDVKIVCKNALDYLEDNLDTLTELDLLSSTIIYDETGYLKYLREKLNKENKNKKRTYENIIEPSKIFVLSKGC